LDFISPQGCVVFEHVCLKEAIPLFSMALVGLLCKEMTRCYTGALYIINMVYYCVDVVAEWLRFTTKVFVDYL
jgi:hypothetical protein